MTEAICCCGSGPDHESFCDVAMYERQRNGLDAAWAEAEAALPGCLIQVQRVPDAGPGGYYSLPYNANASHGSLGGFPTAWASTPAEALRELVANASPFLRDRQP